MAGGWDHPPITEVVAFKAAGFAEWACEVFGDVEGWSATNLMRNQMGHLLIAMQKAV